jgi:uncharacterized protein (DUF1697 family)
MALVVLLKGVNVGGHRTFRPSVLASELSEYDAVNVGAAGTFVVRRPVSQLKLRAELLRRLPFETELMICEGRDFISLATQDPFARELSGPDIVRFLSILAKPHSPALSIPMRLPADGEWLLRIIASNGRYLFGVYRRQMKVISYLGKIEKLVGMPVTTRNWNTITSVVRILKSRE